VMTRQQPMKMAAVEALYETEQPAAFSLFTIGTLDGSRPVYSLRVPGVLSLLADGNLTGKVEGVNDIQREYEQRYGPGDYRPIIPVTYWSFRLMIGLGMLSVAIGALGLWLTRKGRLPTGRRFWRAAIWTIPLPFLANSFGWIFTEMGRQPWTVFGVLQTRDSVSPTVGAGSVLTSLAVFTLLYSGLAVIELRLMMRYAKAGPPRVPEAEVDSADELAFAY
jgi:cytochrome d ubiquinol oxidase subunit I